MINVPVRVKDALRSGDRKKEYVLTFPDVILDDWQDAEYTQITFPDGSKKYTYSFDTDTTIKAIATCEGTPEPEYPHLDLIYDNNNAEEHIHRTYFAYIDQELSFDVESGSTIEVYIWQNILNYSIDIKEKIEYPLVLDNDDLISESVRFDERMCSETNLKFGLCEGTRMSFQYFGYGSLVGYQLKAEIKVEYVDDQNEVAWYTIPMGWYTVDSCSRQASTGIMKASCYNKLLSDYLDNKVNKEIIELSEEGEIGKTETISLYKLLEKLLDGYKIKTDEHSDSTASIIKDHVVNNIMLDSNTTIWYTVFTVGINNEDFSVNEYYAFRANVKRIFDWIVQIFNYETRYVTPEEGGGETITIYDYCFGDYWSSDIASGKVQVWDGGNKLYEKGFAHWLAETEENILDTGFIECLYNYTMREFHFHVFIPCTMSGEYAESIYSSGNPVISHLLLSEMDKFDITYDVAKTIPDVTLRELQDAVFETSCQYGKLDRLTDLFSGIDLNNGRLFPADNLYPADDLYPMSIAESARKSMYSKLWADEGNVHSFRYLIITYKALENGEEVEKTLQRTVNEHGTDNYNMSSNWLFRNLIWTAEQVGEYADAMVLKMRDITWFPFEMWCAGLPYIETGDEIEISINNETYTSYVLRRNLNGIQNLQDEMVNGTLDIY